MIPARSSSRRRSVLGTLPLSLLFLVAGPLWVGAPPALVSLLVHTAHAAAPAGPKATLMRLNGDVDKLLRKKVEPGSKEEAQIKAQVKTLASELLDYTELAKRALGEHWTKLTPKQGNDFVATLKELIERNYIKQLRTNLDYQVSYGDETVEGNEAKVTTTIKIQTKGKSTNALIEYRMLKSAGPGTGPSTGQGSGPKSGPKPGPKTDKWMVYDVITDELSLVRNYRSQFQRIIAQQGYDGLIQRMKKKLAENKE